MSCQKDRHVPIISEGNEFITAFDKTEKGSIERDMSYLPRWQNRVEFDGSFYIALDFDKEIFSFTPDNIQYSFKGRIRLKAKKQYDIWDFTKLTVLPNDIQIRFIVLQNFIF